MEGILVTIQFMDNLKWMKKRVIPWEKTKREEEEHDLKNIEDQLENFYQNIESGFSSNTSCDELKTLEAKRRKFLANKEPTWRLKNKAIWL